MRVSPEGEKTVVVRLKIFGVIALCIGAASAAGSLAQAQWAKSQRDVFVSDCVSSCNENPKVNSKATCGPACRCVGRDLEAAFADYAKLEREVLAKSNQATTDRYNRILKACNDRHVR